jgi:hypothetical protein
MITEILTKLFKAFGFMASRIRQHNKKPAGITTCGFFIVLIG